jgi:type IV secretory pathway VirB4 component
MALGSSGSGKTVLCKCVMEEGVKNNIPLIIVDPQGDIASLALRGNPAEIESHGGIL